MTDRTSTHKKTSRSQSGRPFDNLSGYSGQEYSREDAQRLVAEDPGGRVNPRGDPHRVVPEEGDRRDIPPDNGVRAYFDPESGEVHGSGVGAGAGDAGEDFDTGTPGAARSVSSTNGRRKDD